MARGTVESAHFSDCLRALIHTRKSGAVKGVFQLEAKNRNKYRCIMRPIWCWELLKRQSNQWPRKIQVDREYALDCYCSSETEEILFQNGQFLCGG